MHIADRDNQARHPALVVREPEPLEVGTLRCGEVAALGDHIFADAATGHELVAVVGQ
jgi:hypothetical protein